MTIDALGGILLIPAIAAGLLAALPGYRVEAWLNVLAAFFPGPQGSLTEADPLV